MFSDMNTYVVPLTGQLPGMCKPVKEAAYVVTQFSPNRVLMPFDKASGYLNLKFHSHHHLAMQVHYTSHRKLFF